MSSLVFVFVFCIQKNMKRKSESLTAGGKVCSAVGRDGRIAAATDEATAANSSQSVLGTQSVWASRWVSKTDIVVCLSMIWLAQNRVVLVNEKR